jgi:hypothetical protein
MMAVALISMLLPWTSGVSQAATYDVRGTVDFGAAVQRTDPHALGFGSSTYGATPLSSAAQNDAEQRLDARYVRLPVGIRNGRVTTSAAGTSGTLDVPALVARYRSWGYRVLVVIGGRTNDNDVQPGDATQIIRALGVSPTIDYSAPNEPDNMGLSISHQLTTAKMIQAEGKAIDPGFRLWGPVWTHFDQATLRTFAAGMGADLGGIDYHQYAMGTTTLSTADALRSTPTYGQQVRAVKGDLAALGSSAPVNVDELNFSWRYQDGTPGGNNRFFTAVNTVWMTSALGHILSAGGRGMPYASQNGPLGITVEAGALNPDSRPASSPMPAYWGIAAWTGGKVWPHYKDTLYATTSDDSTGEVFAVNNEAGGYNVVLINKSEGDSKRLALTLRNLAAGSFQAYQSNPDAPYDQPQRVLQGDFSPDAPVSLTLPRMSITVLVTTSAVAPAPAPTPAPTPAPSPVISPPATLPPAPTSLGATRSADGTVADLAWSAPVTDGGSPVTGYLVSRDGQDSTGGGSYSTTLPATTRDFRFTLLNPSATYTFSVHAVTAVGTGPAAQASSDTAPVITAPGTPTSVSATRDKRGSRVLLSWQPPISDGGRALTGYRVIRSATATTGAVSAVVAPTARSFTFTQLSAGQTYTFSVQALNDVGASTRATVTSAAR